jgi:hypothetical protein
VATYDELTLALAQNRQGRVLVAGDMLLALQQAVTLLSAHMMVCSKTYDEASDTWTFAGYAPGFRALELGASAPLYHADITVRDDAPVTVTFRQLD